MIAHKRPGVDCIIASSYGKAKPIKEKPPILIVFEDVGFVDAADHDVVKSAGHVEAGLARHGASIVEIRRVSITIN